MGRVRNALTISPLIEGYASGLALALCCCGTLIRLVGRPADAPTPAAEGLSAETDLGGRMIARQDEVIGRHMRRPCGVVY
jgi:hypothetical protein